MSLIMQNLADIREIWRVLRENRTEIQDRIDKLSVMMKQQQTDSTQTIQKQFAQSAGIIQEVTKI